METYISTFMNEYNMVGQHTRDRAQTSYRNDLCKIVENNEISSGPGRYALGVPNAYGNAVYVPNPTIRMQKWGASHDMTSTKTDVESDLLNISRPSTRTTCGQYHPDQGAAIAKRLTPMPEGDFPKTFERLVDPPCTLRGTGINRWEWLCQNPQENVMIPFEWNVSSRYAEKDNYLSRLPTLAKDNQFLCSTLYVEPAVPVPRTQGPNDPKNFSDAIPGSGGLRAHFTPTGASKMGGGYTDAPPTGPISNPAERRRAATGILEPPPYFGAKH